MISPAITAIVIAVLMALSLWGGFMLSEWRTSPERIVALDNALNWECETTLIYRPTKKEQK